jgi:hypothetical protein
VVDLRVFADTNTLYPFYVCDLPRSGHKSVPVVERMCAAIREAFPDGEIPRKAYEHLIDQMPGPDPDDHVHSAAAIGGHANILLTRDAKGFPQTALRKRGLRVTTVDQFPLRTVRALPGRPHPGPGTTRRRTSPGRD